MPKKWSHIGHMFSSQQGIIVFGRDWMKFSEIQQLRKPTALTGCWAGSCVAGGALAVVADQPPGRSPPAGDSW